MIGSKLEENAIQIQNLKKVFNDLEKPALDSITANLSKKKIIGLIGPDGAGKSTLIRIMAGLLKPEKGTVSLFGYDTIGQSEEIYRIISYMPQKFGLYEDLTVLQNLNLYSDLYGLHKDEKKSRFEKLLNLTQLSSFTHRLSKKLSGGMKQKLGLACSLLRKPRLLLLDEASVGIDPISRRELWEMIFQLKDEGISILWSTSYLDEAEKCDEVLVLNKGKLLYQGDPKKLTEKMKGRTFQIQNISEDKRTVLRAVLKDSCILDGVIQGPYVRVVVREGENLKDIQKYDPGNDAFFKPVEPRFEDAFIDMLGGISNEESPLVSLFPAVEKDGSIIEVEELTKQFDHFIAVDHIEFSVYKGEVFGLLGPNGAGKSTTFKMLCGLLRPSSGTANIEGLSLKKISDKIRKNLGYMAQKFSLYDDMSVLQNLQFFSGIYSVSRKNRSLIIEKMVKLFNFDRYLHTRSSDLPFGFKQRLALSCAIMHKPKILFLDEPTSGVDPLTRREFWNHIHSMVEKGVSIVITTHFMDEAEYCDRIALMSKGKIIQIGTPEELKQSVASKKCPEPTLEDAFIQLSSGVKR